MPLPTERRGWSPRLVLVEDDREAVDGAEEEDATGRLEVAMGLLGLKGTSHDHGIDISRILPINHSKKKMAAIQPSHQNIHPLQLMKRRQCTVMRHNRPLQNQNGLRRNELQKTITVRFFILGSGGTKGRIRFLGIASHLAIKHQAQWC